MTKIEQDPLEMDPFVPVLFDTMLPDFSRRLMCLDKNYNLFYFSTNGTVKFIVSRGRMKTAAEQVFNIFKYISKRTEFIFTRISKKEAVNRYPELESDINRYFNEGVFGIDAGKKRIHFVLPGMYQITHSSEKIPVVIRHR